MTFLFPSLRVGSSQMSESLSIDLSVLLERAPSKLAHKQHLFHLQGFCLFSSDLIISDQSGHQVRYCIRGFLKLCIISATGIVESAPSNLSCTESTIGPSF
eukprot:Blabericola_migrator_1__4400@NODE_2362_length_2877_cov_8_949822_g1480_i0_p2_GENE_NODE_2362_length_2877_cov_8_949822_g1480_i0NODE_2362_length_2877_cov_8_949822_g1480_i0_p2_ORF_typecomplete_len101_score6_45_NODE_2362_length_2877_cov_8_949822_g1480_i025412843